VAQGFKGTQRTVQRFLKQLRDEKRRPLSLPAASPLESLKARQAVWWFIRNPAKLSEEETQKLGLVRQSQSGPGRNLPVLVQAFMKMVHQLEGTTWKRGFCR